MVERESSDKQWLLKARWGRAAWRLRSEAPWNGCLCTSRKRKHLERPADLEAGCPLVEAGRCWSDVPPAACAEPRSWLTCTAGPRRLELEQCALRCSRPWGWGLHIWADPFGLSQAIDCPWKISESESNCLYAWGKKGDRTCYALCLNFTKIFKPASPQRSWGIFKNQVLLHTRLVHFFCGF